jgi:hypothetical protein
MGRRRRTRSTGTSPLWGLLGVLLLVGLVIKFIWWILGAAALVGLVYLVRAIMRENRKRSDALARYHVEIAARADQQHQWVLQGDERGIYGAAGAALMRDIERKAS